MIALRMRILLMRHGDAVADAPGLGDTGRWLSGRGRVVTRRVGTWLGIHEAFTPAEIVTSPLVRAVQTAEIVAGACGITEDLGVWPELATGGSADAAARRLQRHAADGPILLVGHEPSLSGLVLRLLGKSVPWPGFRKSAVLCIDRDDDGHAAFVWSLSPRDLDLTRDPTEL